MILNLTAREVLLQLLGGEDMLIKGEKDFKLVKSAPDLGNFKFFSEFTSEDFEDVVGYIQSSTRLFVIEKHVTKDGEITYTAESYYQNKEGVWVDSIAYEYSEYFADDLEDLKKDIELIQELFEK